MPIVKGHSNYWCKATSKCMNISHSCWRKLHDNFFSVPKKRATKAWKNLVKCAQRKKNGQKKFQRSLSSVPKQKERGQKRFKKKSFWVCPKNKVKKGIKRSSKEVSLSLPQKECQKKVPKQSLKCAQTGKKSAQKKRFTSHLIPYFLLWSPVSQFHPQFWELYG